ncbi:EscU/YscU/HrcU family type III secretion system export apparatus switch protein [Luminiphilus sp.]|nr:EscU/YscU/HrcU family type III secretion system export apparatus switch protein [Luminiphilus sp.]
MSEYFWDGRNRKNQSSVALRYDGSQAPVVVATGSGEIAEAIKAKAQESGVPIVEDPRLAQLLAQVPLGEEIPAELYRAVAEVLVFVMQMEMALQSWA